MRNLESNPSSTVLLAYRDTGTVDGAETNFEKDNSAFSNSVFKTHIIHAMTQVSQGILSTIVVHQWFEASTIFFRRLLRNKILLFPKWRQKPTRPILRYSSVVNMEKGKFTNFKNS